MAYLNTLRDALLPFTKKGRQLRSCRALRGYLDRIGWIRSQRERMPVDAQGEPLPWITYPAIAFLKDRLREDLSLFEYGSGNSTLWWSRRASRVVSYEHDPTWYSQMKGLMPANVEYVHRTLEQGDDYCQGITNYEDEFDVVVIDGRQRVACAINSLTALKPGGVLLWDNSERERYEPGYEFLRSNGFRRIDFHGQGPSIAEGWCTSFFYRDGNCLGI